MRQIINGKKYDTETANYFGACEVTNVKCGFRECIALFRKKMVNISCIAT